MNTVFVLGSLNMDTTYYVDALPDEGMTVPVFSTARAAGGKALNQAVACSYCGGNVNLIGAVGKDENGRYLLNILKKYNVHFKDISYCDRTGSAVILVDKNGKNLIVVDGGSNRFVPKSALKEKISAGDYMVAQLETKTDTVKFYFELAKKRGAKTVLNLSPYCAEAEKLLPVTDLLVINEHEASMLFKIPIKSAQDCFQYSEKIGEIKNLRVIITLGKNGAVIIDGGEVTHIKGNKVKTVDTQGAGDAFLGITVGCLAKGLTLSHAVQTANSVAARCVEVKGSTVASLAQIGSEIGAKIRR